MGGSAAAQQSGSSVGRSDDVSTSCRKEADCRTDAGRHEKVGFSCIAGAAALGTEMTTPASSTTTTQAHGAAGCARGQSQSSREALLSAQFGGSLLQCHCLTHALPFWFLKHMLESRATLVAARVGFLASSKRSKLCWGYATLSDREVRGDVETRSRGSGTQQGRCCNVIASGHVNDHSSNPEGGLFHWSRPGFAAFYEVWLVVRSLAGHRNVGGPFNPDARVPRL